MKDFFTNHLDTIIAYFFGAGGLVGAIVERKKRKTDALSSMQELYDRFVQDAEKKFSGFEKEILKLNNKIISVEERWKEKYEALKQDYETYKKEHP